MNNGITLRIDVRTVNRLSLKDRRRLGKLLGHIMVLCRKSKLTRETSRKLEVW